MSSHKKAQNTQEGFSTNFTNFHEKVENLLNQGFPVYEDEDSDVPSRIYNVYMGVVYEARRTEYGKSFHGFPWRGDMAIGRRIPAGVKKRLEDRARENNEWRELKRWMKHYG